MLRRWLKLLNTNEFEMMSIVFPFEKLPIILGSFFINKSEKVLGIKISA